MRLIWATDPHFNHVPVDAWERWVAEVAAGSGEGLLVTGDISEGDDVVFQLHRMAAAVALPIYFVLGNHDFYRSSIAVTRQRVVSASRDDRLLHYLTDESALELAPGVFLVGEDGWGDATQGDFEGSPIRLNDFALIDDFRSLPKERCKEQLGQLGLESAQRLEAKLHGLPIDATEVLVLTHVPPFRESCWYEGHTTDDQWAPFFVCGEVGQMLRRVSRSRPELRLTVLCGHTHHAGVAQIDGNLVVHTGGAQYGRPEVGGVVVVDESGLRIESR